MDPGEGLLHSGEKLRLEQRLVLVENLAELPAAGKAAMKKIHKLLRLAWEQYQDGNYVHIGAAGSYIKRVNPDFDARTYGYRNLPKLIEAFPEKYELIMSKSSQWLYRCRR